MAARRVLGYVRVSTTEQVGGNGLDVQRQAISDYCKAHGLRLVGVLSDEGLSGSNGLDTRDALATAIAMLERGEVAGLVVYRLDRLARDLLLQETLMTRLRAVGAEVDSVQEEGVDSDDPTRVLVRQVLGAIGQYERALIRGRMAAGKAAKVARGGYGGGRPRFGQRAADGALVPDEREQAVIARARELRAEGLSLRRIAERLEAEGCRPKAGQRWHPPQVARLLDAGAGH